MPGYQCGACDGAEPAVVLITPLSGAETLAVGNNCLPVTWCGMFAGVTGLDPEQLWDAAVALAEATVDMQAQADGEPAEGGQGASESPAGPPDGGNATATAEVARSAVKRTPRSPAQATRSRRVTK